MWIPHQDLLLGLQAHLIVLSRVVAACAGARSPAHAIVGETLTVELQAARLTAIAGLVEGWISHHDGSHQT